MIFLPRNASKARQREAANARKNRVELKKAMNNGTVTRRDLIKMGIMTSAGMMVMKNGLNPYAGSAYAADIPTGTPRSWDIGIPASQGGFGFYEKPLPRLNNLTRIPLKHPAVDSDTDADRLVPDFGRITPGSRADDLAADWGENVRRISNHTAGDAGGPSGDNTHITHTVNLANDDNTSNVEHTGPDGPAEGRPPGEFFAHQRWDELTSDSSKNTMTSPHGPVGILMTLGQIKQGQSFFDMENSSKNPLLQEDTPTEPNNRDWALQAPNAVWPYGEGRTGEDGRATRGTLTPPILQARYGEPVLYRCFTNLPFGIEENGGFGRNEPSIHNHNAHNGSESDGATNAFMFPGQYYDTLFSTILARHDHTGNAPGRAFMERVGVKDSEHDGFRRWASSPTDDGGIVRVNGDPREIQGTLWFHDHRFFFTAENVYKGFAALMEYFSGVDRGYERSLVAEEGAGGTREEADIVNLRLPSGHRNGKTWGNRDFDWYLVIQDIALSQDGNLFFDIFDTDGFLGDVMHVNWQVQPFMKVLPRKYRFRTLSAGMSRWIRLSLTDDSGKAQVIKMIANDGNLLPHPVTRKLLDIQGTAERYDIIIDFSQYNVGDELFLVNRLAFSNGRGPDETVGSRQAFNNNPLTTPTHDDPAVGKLMMFKVVNGSFDDTTIIDKVATAVADDGVNRFVNSRIESTDEPGTFLTIANSCGGNDKSQVPENLWPVGTVGDDSDTNPTNKPQIPQVKPDRKREVEFVRSGNENGGLPFDHPGDDPWAIKVNGEAANKIDMRRVSLLIPRPGEIEHWTIKSSNGWGHPVHLHFEEAITLKRDGKRPSNTERNIRKDVWHIGSNTGDVKFQVSFGEFGGAYVNHCHNTVHEDNAMLLRYDNANDTFRTDNDGTNASGGAARDAVGGAEVAILPTPDPRPWGVTYVESCNLREGRQGRRQNTINVDACDSGEPIGPVVKGPQTVGEL